MSTNLSASVNQLSDLTSRWHAVGGAWLSIRRRGRDLSSQRSAAIGCRGSAACQRRPQSVACRNIDSTCRPDGRTRGDRWLCLTLLPLCYRNGSVPPRIGYQRELIVPTPCLPLGCQHNHKPVACRVCLFIVDIVCGRCLFYSGGLTHLEGYQPHMVFKKIANVFVNIKKKTYFSNELVKPPKQQNSIRIHLCCRFHLYLCMFYGIYN